MPLSKTFSKPAPSANPARWPAFRIDRGRLDKARLGGGATTNATRLLMGVIVALLLPNFVLAATYTVDTVLDSSDAAYRICSAAADDCSLRGALLEANSSLGSDTIVLAPGQTYTISIPGNEEDVGFTGDFDIFDDLIIEGSDAVLDGAALDRLLHIQGVDVEIHDLILQAGANTAYGIWDQGGAIRIDGGSVELFNVTLQSNAAYDGGAIYQDSGHLTLSNSTLSANNVETSGGAIYIASGSMTLDQSTFDGNTSGEYGGAIYFDGTTLIATETELNNNARTGPEFAGDGGALYMKGGEARFTDSVFTLNEAVYPNGGLCARGGAIAAESGTVLIAIDTDFLDNTSGYHGGAIYSEGIVSLERVQLDDNEAIFDGGALAQFGGELELFSIDARRNAGRFGGVVYAQTSYNYGVTVDVEDSFFQSNTALSGGGLFIKGSGDGGKALVDVADSSFSFNNAVGGGAISATGGFAELDISQGWFFQNKATERGGAILNLQDSSGASILEVRQSSLYANEAAVGGGLSNSGHAWVYATEIYENIAEIDGGGLHVSSERSLLVLNRSLVADNVAGDDGGGIYQIGGGDDEVSLLVINNSTVSRNQAGGLGGGIAVTEDPLYNAPAYATLYNATIFNNVSLNGPGDALVVSQGTVQVRNSILATPNAPECATLFGGVIASHGYNIEAGTSCSFINAGDQQNTAPLLLPLSDNGGFTRTHATDVGSPAIDGGNPNGCVADRDGDGLIDPNPLQGDQRSVPRQATCDVGAYEGPPAV